MNNKILQNVVTAILTLLVIFAISAFGVLPWWGFIIPTILLGAVLSYVKWDISSFFVGFFVGFILWTGLNFYYNSTSYGHIFGQLEVVMEISKTIMLLASGLIGGLLTGLSLHTGKHMLNLLSPTE